MSSHNPTMLVVDTDPVRRRKLAQLLRRVVSKALEIDRITSVPSREACEIVVLN